MPELPYNGTSGWSGSETSEARARNADSNGTTAARQTACKAALQMAQSRGLTVREYATAANLHHGQASAVLSVLHKTEQIARLTDTRNRCAIYVANDYINNRPTAKQKSNRSATRIVELVKEFADDKNVNLDDLIAKIESEVS